MKVYNKKGEFVPRYKRLARARNLNIGIWLLVGFALVIAIAWVMNTASNGLFEEGIVRHMRSTCEQSAQVRDGALEEQCGREIDGVQARGYEVLSKNGTFWAEKN